MESLQKLQKIPLVGFRIGAHHHQHSSQLTPVRLDNYVGGTLYGIHRNMLKYITVAGKLITFPNAVVNIRSQVYQSNINQSHIQNPVKHLRLIYQYS